MTDALAIDQLHILNSPDIRDWPATTAITRLELRPSGVHVEFTKQAGADRWPDVPFGEGSTAGAIQYTLWIVLEIGGAYYGAGVIEFWYGLHENGGPVEHYSENWYYDANRWAPMTGHQPAPGERVYFLVTSGDARHGNDGVGLKERSNIVAVAFPGAAGDVFTFDAAAPAPEPPAPAPPPPLPWPSPKPAPTPVPISTDDLAEKLGVLLYDADRIVEGLQAIANALESIDARIAALQSDGVRIHT